MVFKPVFPCLILVVFFCGLKWNRDVRIYPDNINKSDSINELDEFITDTLYLIGDKRLAKSSCMREIILALRNDIIPANPHAFNDEPAPSVEDDRQSQKIVFNHFNKDLKTRNFSKIKVQISTFFFSKYSQSQEFDDVIMISEWHLKSEAEAKSLFNDLNRIPQSSMSYELIVFSNEWLWYHHGSKVYFLTFPSYVEEFPFKDYVGQVVESTLEKKCP